MIRGGAGWVDGATAVRTYLTNPVIDLDISRVINRPTKGRWLTAADRSGLRGKVIDHWLVSCRGSRRRSGQVEAVAAELFSYNRVQEPASALTREISNALRYRHEFNSIPP